MKYDKGFWQPHGKTQEILDRAIAHVHSVPYTVSLRWLFYRLLQDGLYREKADYDRLKDLLARARKSLYGGWHPSTLADDTRKPEIRGDGFESPAEWAKVLSERLACNLDMWSSQPAYVEVWYEAKAMSGQFRRYVNPNVTLMPFGGDASIPLKWEASQRLQERAEECGGHAVVCYFGDYDKKGREIPEHAWADIEAWANVDAEFVRLGLNAGDGERFGIPENFEHPGDYQWEALGDAEAAEVIGQVDNYLDLAAFVARAAEAEAAAAKMRAKLQETEL